LSRGRILLIAYLIAVTVVAVVNTLAHWHCWHGGY